MPYDDIARILDPDLGFDNRRPASSHRDFDPRWNVSFHWSAAHDFLVPFVTRGSCLLAPTSGATLAQSKDGPYLNIPSANNRIECNTPTYWPNTTRGTIVTAFRAAWASGSPPGNSAIAFGVLDGTANKQIQQLQDFSDGTLSFGWFNNPADSRVAITRGSRWASGDLVVAGFSYHPGGNEAYINGAQVGSNTTAPATFNAAGTSGFFLSIGDIHSFSENGWTGILYTTILDRELTADEWAEISIVRPMTWMYSGTAFAFPLVSSSPPPPSTREYAVTVITG